MIRVFCDGLNGGIIEINEVFNFNLNINEASFYDFSNCELSFTLSTFRKPTNSDDERVFIFYDYIVC